MNDYDKIISCWHKVQDLECQERFMNISRCLEFGVSNLIFRSDQEIKEYYNWKIELKRAKEELDGTFQNVVVRKRSKNGI